MKFGCLFGHNWVFSNKTQHTVNIHTVNIEEIRYVYHTRKCARCGLVQDDIGYFEASWGVLKWISKWVTPEQERKYRR